MADVHAEGMVNSSGNLLYWAKEDPEGPFPPCATPRFFAEDTFQARFPLHQAKAARHGGQEKAARSTMAHCLLLKEVA